MAGEFGGFGDFGGLGAMTSPWDFGTGYNPQQSFIPGTMNQPVPPPVDLPQQMAASLAQSGIRPSQFMANPAIAAPVLAPPVTPTMNNSWDPSPVSTPGGGPVSLPQVMRPNLPNQQTMSFGAQDTEGANSPAAGPMMAPGAAEASAGGSPEEAKAGSERTAAQKLVEGLRGVRMPTPPTPQTIRSPALPQHAAIKSGELMALLAALGGTAQGRQGLPATLGASLKGQF